MPNVYRNLRDNLPPQDNHLLNTPGGRIMGQGRAPLNFTQLFRKFVDTYANLWTWNPGPRTPSGAEVLDGTSMYGQCAAFARALVMLATSPAPYGLGLGNDQVELVKYRGSCNCGFISPHDRVHFNLDRNVKVVGSNPSQRADLYYWENHYVARYLGRYYDPSYDTEYTTLDEMTTYQLQSGTIPHQGETFEKASGLRETVYFKQIVPPETLGTGRLAVEGPFANLP